MGQFHTGQSATNLAMPSSIVTFLMRGHNFGLGFNAKKSNETWLLGNEYSTKFLVNSLQM
jgi:hypothetical protein